MNGSIPPADSHRTPWAALRRPVSIVVEDGAEATVLREQGVAAVAEQVEVERLVALPLAVALDLDRDGLRRLAGGERQLAGPGDVVVVAGRGGAVDGPERHGHGLIVRGGKCDGEREQGRLALLAL